jgi:abequosyltransferase
VTGTERQHDESVPDHSRRVLEIVYLPKQPLIGNRGIFRVRRKRHWLHDRGRSCAGSHRNLVFHKLERTMLCQNSAMSSIVLSVCISTFERSALIGPTLESIISQVTEECEIVVLDASSTCLTEEVVSAYLGRCRCLRYIKQGENNGVDRDFDRAVELARGKYCWLMSDDDFLRPGAIERVLSDVRQNYSLVVVNVEGMDETMSRVIVRKGIDLKDDRVYEPEDMDDLFEICQDWIGYIGCVVVRRDIWLARDRVKYYGSWFIHVGVLFQTRLPGKTLVIATPFISVRLGSHSWIDKLFEIEVIRFPEVIRSSALSDMAKRRLITAEPWRSVGRLLFFRAMGAYSVANYRRHIRPRIVGRRGTIIPTVVALIPCILANTALSLYYGVLNPGETSAIVGLLKKSQYSLANLLR